MQSLLVSYAQNREDLILEGFFKGVQSGFYVDIGANHPIKHSVTKLFYRKGWRGIHVEPNEGLCAMLRFDRPEDAVLNIGISNQRGTLEFTEYINHGLSTFSKEMSEAYTQKHSVFTDTFWKYDVEVRTLAEVFAEQNVAHIHFMKVDVEGYEYEVLEGNDWQRFRPEMICIEANHLVKDWRPLLARHGYTKVFNDGLNDYYLAKEALHRADNFSYATALLESGEVVTAPVDDKLRIAEQNLALASLHFDEVRQEKVRAEFRADWYERAPLRWFLRKTAHAFKGALVNRLRPVPPESRVVFDSTVRVAAGNTPAAALQKLARSYAKSVHTEQAIPSPLAAYVRRGGWFLYRAVRKVAKVARKTTGRGK